MERAGVGAEVEEGQCFRGVADRASGGSGASEAGTRTREGLRAVALISDRGVYTDHMSQELIEIIFEVTEDEVDGGYSADALGYGIHTQGDSVAEIRSNVKEAVDCYFDDTMPRPKLIRLHFVRDEVVVA